MSVPLLQAPKLLTSGFMSNKHHFEAGMSKKQEAPNQCTVRK